MKALKKTKNDAALQELMAAAGRMNIEVRTERLLREVGYHARSGRCRLKGQDLIILDRDAPLPDQVEFLAAELEERRSASTAKSSR
ncbi:MAG TPA: hypothetical protein VGL70_00400 [Candidatus Binatia bacterium]|jgi:hypothetical protein